MGNLINGCRSKYVRKGSMDAIGVCDYSGFQFSHSDLVKQKEWRGNNLVWNGFMVGSPFVDVPNQQQRPPLVKADPEVVKNPRPDLPAPQVGTAQQILNTLYNNVSWNQNPSPNNAPSSNVGTYQQILAQLTADPWNQNNPNVPNPPPYPAFGEDE